MRRRQALRLACGLGVVFASRRAAAQALQKLRIVGPATESSTPNYYALRSGMFERAGLDVELTGMASGAAATTAVVAGAYDIARSSVPPLFAAHLRGIPITIVAGENQYRAQSPSALLQIPVDAVTATAAELNGKTIGAPALDDINVLATRAWMAKNGGDWRSLKFVEVANAALEAALVQHRVDAAVLQSAQLDASLAAHTTKTLADPQAAIAPAFLTAAFIARSDWAEAHRDVVRRLYRVMTAAAAYVNAHLAETLPLVMEITSLSPAAVAKMHRSVSSGSVEPGLVQPLIDVSARFDTIARSFPAQEIIFT